MVTPDYGTCPECGTDLVSPFDAAPYCPGDDLGECPGYDTYDEEFDDD